MVNVTGSFTNGAMSFTVSNLSSGLTVPNDYTVFTTFDALGYIIDQSQNDIIFILACTLPCKTCSGTQTNCTSCYNDTTITSNVFYFASANQCLSTCLDGFYSETVQYTCAPCSATCLTCTITSTNCLTCVLTSLYPYLNKTSATNGTCLAQCDYGMYPDITSTCVLCVDPCKACTNLTTCLSCNSGRYFYQFNCLLSCPANYTIANNSTNNCDACSATCLTCIGSTTNCSSCNAGTALYQGNCIVQCPAPVINKTGVCQPCDSPCATCSLISTNCTSCMPNTTTPHYMSTNNSCLDVCPSTYYNTTAINDCLPCSSLNINCVLCKNATSCLTCDAWFVFFSSNASCLNFTPSGYANISGIAQPCEGDCSTCFQLTTNCTACKTLNLLGNQCIPTCPTTYAPIFGVCTACQLPCATCSQSINNCTSCVSNSTPQVYLSGNQCVVTCPTTTYANSTLQQCVQCVSPCQTCSSQTVCQSCVINFNLYQTSCLDGYCPGGTTPIASVCVNCTSPCLSCSTSASTCTSCIHGLTPEVYLANTICLQASQCPNGTYPDSSNNTCVNCSPPCLTCSSLTSCLSCMADYNLEGTLCKSQCLDGFMPVNSICTACKDPCATCAGSLTTCLTCNYTSGNPLYLSGYRCISTCPETTYPNGTTFTCNPCVSPCSSCSSLSTCNTCMSGYYLYGTYCSSQCPPGYVGIALTCEKCSTGCLSCVNSTFTCTACQASYYMLNLTSQCVQNCPTGLYEDPIQGVCIGCILPCLGCTGTPTNCTICQTGSLYNNSCVPNCPDAYFSYNSVCETCPIGCITCTSLTRCTECDVLYYSLDNACITSCPSQKAIVINKTCTPCTDINCA
jgi:proprotein convertase subtilisin/kexin type 5